MPNKILLIRPENIYDHYNYPPLNLIHLGSSLKSNGYDVKIINCGLEKDFLSSIRDNLKDCLLVGITLLTSEVPGAYKVVKFVKENSVVPIVVGGWHCTLFPNQMVDCEYIDYVVIGGGEEYIVEIADALRENKTMPSKIFQKRCVNLNKLPIPDYELDANIENHITTFLTDKLGEYVSHPIRWLPYETSRGCPSQCTFCCNVVTGNTRYRKKSAKKVVSEIEYIVKKYNITHLKILDDNFFPDIERVREVCKGIIKKDLHFTWDGECRADYFKDGMLDDETLDLAKRSGLVQLTIGIESGSFTTLMIMKKGITPNQGEFAIKKCNDYGIIARCSFIIEIPGETIEDIKKTISFVNHLRKQYPWFICGIQIFRPYPKCELTENLIEKGYLLEPKRFVDWSDNEILKIYTGVHDIRPWQIDSKYSTLAAHYQGVESGFIKKHMLDRKVDILINKIFMGIARIRNKVSCYRFPVDRKMYLAFQTNFYKRMRKLEIAKKLN